VLGLDAPELLLGVTHQGNITALTGFFPRSGEAVIVTGGASGRILVPDRPGPSKSGVQASRRSPSAPSCCRFQRPA
jgi:hypothetical protein